MIHLKSIIILISLIVVVFYFPVIGSSFIISDDRVRNLNVSPVLGRGYSVGTNSFQSTCLKVNETISPSYNYDCKYLHLGHTPWIIGLATHLLSYTTNNAYKLSHYLSL